MPDNWEFVTAAYGLAAAVFAGYWRWLVRKDRELTSLGAERARPPASPREADPRRSAS
jgi:hypothetical protein